MAPLLGVPTTDRVQPWGRKRGESVRAYNHFMNFLILGKDRNLNKAAEICGVTVGALSYHSRKWNWYERAAAFEEYYQVQRIESLEAERSQQFNTVRSLSRKAYTILEAHFDKLIENIGLHGAGEVKPEVLVKLFAETAKLDRQAMVDMGAASAFTEQEMERLQEQWANTMVDTFQRFANGLELTHEQRAKFDEIARAALAGELAREETEVS